MDKATIQKCLEHSVKCCLEKETDFHVEFHEDGVTIEAEGDVFPSDVLPSGKPMSGISFDSIRHYTYADQEPPPPDGTRVMIRHDPRGAWWGPMVSTGKVNAERELIVYAAYGNGQQNYACWVTWEGA